MADVKAPRERAQYTKELVKIAQASGMTQEKIAALCRVHQSVVSGWARGTTKAHVDQLERLHAMFGARLNRTAARVYRVPNPEASDAGWEATDTGRWLRTLSEVPGHAQGQREVYLHCGLDPDHDHAPATVEGVIGLYRALHAQWNAPPRLARIEGHVALRYTFWRSVTQKRRGTAIEVRDPWRRLIVHRQRASDFVVVEQDRLVHFGDEVQVVQRAILDSHETGGRPWLECADDAGRWMSSVHGPMTADALVSWIDEFSQRLGHHARDTQTLPFLVRKMLADQGIELDCVEVVAAAPRV